MVEYFGIFFDKENSKKIIDNEKVHLDKLPNNFHCTFCYKPDSLKLFNEVAGKTIDIALIGYACDGKNSGYKVDFSTSLKKYFKNFDKQGNVKIPHLTTSLSKDGKAVDTANLNFINLNEPILLKGRFGYFIRNNNKAYISFTKVEVEELNN